MDKMEIKHRLLMEKYKSKFAFFDMTTSRWELPDGKVVFYPHKRFSYWDEKDKQLHLICRGKEICKSWSINDWGYYYTYIKDGKSKRGYYKGVRKNSYEAV